MKKLPSVFAILLIAFPVYAQSTLYSNASSVGIGTNAPTAGAALDLSYETNSVLLPTGTSGQRPTGVAGMMRYNSANPGIEAFYGGSWNLLGTGTVSSIGTNNGITGGTIIGSGTIGLASIGTSQLLANPTGSSGVPVGTSLSALIDSSACSGQGSILYRGVSSWECLAPGTAGQVLQTQGVGADPAWVTSGSSTSPFANYVLLTSGSSWTVPTGVTQVLVSEIGGGGGGGNSTGTPFAGGGGRGAFVTALVTVTPGGSVSYSVGSAGTGSSNGGDTTFGSLTAAGGQAGAQICSAGGPPSMTQSTPTSSVTIISEDTSNVATNCGGGVNPSGNGSSSPWGTGGSGSPCCGFGGNASGYGAGGGGGAGVAGGNGSPGAIAIRY